MKKLFLFSIPLLFLVSSALYAESRVLPSVVDNSTYPGGSAYRTAAPSANAMYEVLSRLEQLQHEVQQLRGVVEEQSQTISDLKKRQGNIYSDLDQRMQALSGNGALHKSSTGTASQMAQAVSNKSLTASAATGSTRDRNAAKNPKVVPEKSKAVSKGTQPSSVNQKELYQAAYETLRNGHNTRAISEFKLLLTEFPNGEYADNAQYWLGEAYKVNQDFNAAKAAFSRVVAQYRKSPKVPDALLKLGYIELEQNNMAKARDYLTQVTVNYPGTTAAHLAAKKLMELKTR